MAYIYVNHQKLGAAATAVDDYLQTLKLKMVYADSCVYSMVQSWQGNDAQAFSAKWDCLEDQFSTYYALVKSYENYADFLRDAESRYKRAQADAIDRAYLLPSY